MGALRQLTISQQVGLLFLGLFGLLAIVTMVEVSRTLRDLTPEQQDLHERYKREAMVSAKPAP